MRVLVVVIAAACSSPSVPPPPPRPVAVAAKADAAEATAEPTDDSTDALPPDYFNDTYADDVAPGEAKADACPAARLRDIQLCLLQHSMCGAHPGELERDKVPDVAVWRAHTTGCADVYVLAKRGATWHAVSYLMYLQAHGRRDTQLTVKAIHDVHEGAKRTTMIDYHVVDDITEIAGENVRDNRTEEDHTLACVWPPDGGDPVCK